MLSFDLSQGAVLTLKGAVLGAEQVPFGVPNRRRKGAEHGNERVPDLCVRDPHTPRRQRLPLGRLVSIQDFRAVRVSRQ